MSKKKVTRKNISNANVRIRSKWLDRIFCIVPGFYSIGPSTYKGFWPRVFHNSFERWPDKIPCIGITILRCGREWTLTFLNADLPSNVIKRPAPDACLCGMNYFKDKIG